MPKKIALASQKCPTHGKKLSWKKAYEKRDDQPWDTETVQQATQNRPLWFSPDGFIFCNWECYLEWGLIIDRALERGRRQAQLESDLESGQLTEGQEADALYGERYDDL